MSHVGLICAHILSVACCATLLFFFSLLLIPRLMFASATSIFASCLMDGQNVEIALGRTQTVQTLSQQLLGRFVLSNQRYDILCHNAEQWPAPSVPSSPSLSHSVSFILRPCSLFSPCSSSLIILAWVYVTHTHTLTLNTNAILSVCRRQLNSDTFLSILCTCHCL